MSATDAQPDPTPRRVLLLVHTGRDEALEVAREFCASLCRHEMTVRLMTDEAAALGYSAGSLGGRVEITDSEDDAGHDCELAIVVGGDGTILRAAEITHVSGTPIRGVNLGHVGFLPLPWSVVRLE